MTWVKIAGLSLLLSAILAFGQITREKPEPPSGIKVDVDLVLVNATVTNSDNRYVNGLQQENFHIWEDKLEQQIQYFSAENVPTSVGIIFDVSGSMENKLQQAQLAANTFLRMGDRDDEYFLVQFSDAPHVIQEFTTDVAQLMSRLVFTRTKGSTSLYDAVYLGMAKVIRGNNTRKALLVITDGQDNHSRYSFSDVSQFAKERDVMIYSIGITDPMDPGQTGTGVLQNLADVTGALAFFPTELQSLPEICRQIGADLKNQYVIGYRSSNSASDGKWRKLRVNVTPPKGIKHLSVRAKSGYFAPTISRAAK
jgi:Ca-activated chloride channel family protein